MRRPWQVPFYENRKLQSCLALSLALHLLVIFGITHRERVTQFPILPPIMVKFTKRPPPQRVLARRERPIQRPLVRRPALHAAPVAAVRPGTLLGYRNERVRGCAPQFFGCLKMVSGREFPVRGCEKFAGGP